MFGIRNCVVNVLHKSFSLVSVSAFHQITNITIAVSALLKISFNWQGQIMIQYIKGQYIHIYLDIFYKYTYNIYIYIISTGAVLCKRKVPAWHKRNTSVAFVNFTFLKVEKSYLSTLVT